MKPDILLAGHIVKDLTSDGWRVGGGVAYAAVQARRFGLSVAAVTSCSADLRPQDIVPSVAWHVLESPESTSFENLYVDGRRAQRVLSRAGQITAADIPADWLDAPLVFLCPVFDEVDRCLEDLPKQDGALWCLGAQGWLRRLEGDRVVVDRAAGTPEWLRQADIVFVSEEDVVDAEDVAGWRETVPVVVLTRGRRGSTVWDALGRHDVPAFETVEIDPTGAGDVFATVFMLRYRETGDAAGSARFASAAAALAVRAAGIAGIGDRDEIETLIRTQRAAHTR